MLPSINYYCCLSTVYYGNFTSMFSRNKKFCKCSSEHISTDRCYSWGKLPALPLCFFPVYFCLFWIFFCSVVELLMYNCGGQWWQWLHMSVVGVNLWKWNWVAEENQFHMRRGVSVPTPPLSKGLRLDMDLLFSLSPPCFLTCSTGTVLNTSEGWSLH